MTSFITLGPSGTDHEHALLRYLEFQRIPNATTRLVDDLLDGLELVRDAEDHFLLQNSAHPDVATVTERYWRSVRVLDTFIAPTKAMAIVRRRDVPRPRTIAVMPATIGYLEQGKWENVVTVRAKPLIGAGLLDGTFEAGLTHLSWAAENPDELVVLERIGPVDTAWIVYGRASQGGDALIGLFRPDLYHRRATPLEPDGMTGDAIQRLH